MDVCASCGQPLKEETKFCANCGAPRAAEVTAPSEVVPTGAAPGRRRWFLSVGALAVVGVLVVGLLFVFGAFKGDRGASSPQAALAQLVDSITTLQPSQVTNAIAPGEVSGFADLEKSVNSPTLKKTLAKVESQFTSQMKAMSGALPGSFGPAFSALSGISSTEIGGAMKAISVKLSNAHYSTTNLADGIADVAMTDGDITLSVNAAKIPATLRQKMRTILSGSNDVPSWMNDLINGNTTISHTWHIGDWVKAANAQGQKFDVIVVKQGSGWYVSLYGTIAQHVYEGVSFNRQRNGEPALAQPSWRLYSNPPRGIVAGSANQVPANLAKAFNDRSVQEVFQNLPQSEARAVYPYVPLLQSAAGRGGSGSVAISGVQANTTGVDGDLVHVTYTQGTATVTDNGQNQSASVNHGCYTLNGNQQCVDQWPDFAQAFGIDKGIPITLRKVSGGYQLDPIATYVGLISSALDHADQLATAYSELMTYVQDQFNALSGSQTGS